MEKSNQILSFEEFCRRDEWGIPNYNNFFLMFVDFNVIGYPNNEMIETYRNVYPMPKLREEAPELERRLTENITKDVYMGAMEMLDALKRNEKDLYEAYKIMRPYVASDLDLFR